MTSCTSLVVHPTVGHLKLHNYSWLSEEISLNPVIQIKFLLDCNIFIHLLPIHKLRVMVTTVNATLNNILATV
jgi:hypothetical protein